MTCTLCPIIEKQWALTSYFCLSIAMQWELFLSQWLVIIVSSLSGVKVGACQLTDFYFSSMRSLGPQGYWGRSSKTQTKSSAQGLTLHIKGPLNNRNLCLGNRVQLQVSKDYSSTCSTDCIFFYLDSLCFIYFYFCLKVPYPSENLELHINAIT